MNKADRLVETLAFRVTEKEAEQFRELAWRKRQRQGEALRNIFRKGLKAEERAK